MKTKTVTDRPSFQGDLCIRRVAEIPSHARPVAAEDGRFVVAHSETGHHHVVDSRAARMLIDETNAFIAWLDIAKPTVLEHLRDYDTHEPLALLPGKYEVRRQREHVPEGWRRIAD